MNHALAPKLGWLSIVRLGLVQTALGGIVVLTTSTINRVMVVELSLPAILPGLLVALHFSVQLLRPRWGHNSDQGGRSTPWILAGMATLATGGFLAALGTAWMSVNVTAGILLAVLAFLLIGLGAGAAGTSLLVLLAKRVAPERRAAAATIVWVMMIAGFVVTAGTAGHFLDPFSYKRLVVVAASVSALAFVIAVFAVWGIEGTASAVSSAAAPAAKTDFRAALAQVWGEPEARHFTIFVFISMLAYSAQDLILEPYAGEIFRYTPGASTKLSGVQHGGVLLGMIMVAITGSLLPAAWRLRRVAGADCAVRQRQAAGVILSPGVLAWLLQRHVRDRRYRLNDDAGQRRRHWARGRADGPLGCRASHRIRVRRADRRRRRRCHAVHSANGCGRLRHRVPD
jgi:MFS transporter, BCD family, chlorophyll transporter